MSVQINDSIAICFSSPEEKTAADFLAHELQLRTCESFINDNAGKSIVFHLDKGFADDDSFEIIEQENKLVFTAARLRGLIFAAAQLLKNQNLIKIDSQSSMILSANTNRLNQYGDIRSDIAQLEFIRCVGL